MMQRPHNIQAEQAVIGGVLMDNAALDRIGDMLAPEHFFDPVHQELWRIINRVVAGGQTATAIQLQHHVAEWPDITETMTAGQYVSLVASHAVTIFGVKNYAKTVRELATRRGLMTLGEDMAGAASESDDVPAQIADVESRLMQIQQTGANERPVLSLHDAAIEAVNQVSAAYQRGDGLAGLATGISTLDAMLGGLAPSDLIIIAGRPGMGKTALAVNVGANIAMRQDKRAVGIMSMEMAASQLALRVMSESAGIPAHRLRTGQVSDHDIGMLMRGAKALAAVPLYIDQSGGLTLAQVASRARRMKRQSKIELLIIDYLQLMAGGSIRGGNRTQEITEITTGLKALAKELDIPIVALSQLSRQVENRPDKRPQLSDLRESGSIEQDADIVLFVYREEYYLAQKQPDPAEAEHVEWQQKMSRARGKAEVIIGKQRHGPAGTVNLLFDRETTTFSDAPQAAEVRYA